MEAVLPNKNLHSRQEIVNRSLSSVKTRDIFVETRPVNVSKVRQLSPFRYPGGKTWLVPELCRRVAALESKPTLFIEPFAGGGIISLSIASQNLATKIVMCELDPDVASVWRTIFEKHDYLCNRILSFDVNLQNVNEILGSSPENCYERAFKTIVKNRTQRGGIIAPGASLVRKGENGKGLASRWYPNTLVKRIQLIHQLRDKITFFEDDGLKIIKKYRIRKKAFFFIDPPYTAGGKKAGKRLYQYNNIDHAHLFDSMRGLAGRFLMTYDDTDEVKKLALSRNFSTEKIPMKNTHHAIIYELLIT